MGDHSINISANIESRNQFLRQLLDDVEALELMFSQNMLEDDKIRIGAEQEFFIIDEQYRPSVESNFILSALNDPHFNTEMTRYTLEINLDPLVLKDNCFEAMEKQLKDLLQKARNVAGQYRAKVLLAGILPTITKNELSTNFMTPLSRYQALNENSLKMRGSDFNIHIKGVDELTIIHESILFEGCNASFQTHLQVPPNDFIASYNWAQAIAGPLLAISTNSPLLLGRELWSETRIALFQQSVDTRSSSYALKEQDARVSFGQNWASGSIADQFKTDIARHKVILTKTIKENALEELRNGKIPKLKALTVHNGTIYHWNRACYGISEGKPHVRIENRYLPAGPSIKDQMANFALWVGLMMARPKEFDDMPSVMDFKDAKANFIKAARTGKESMLYWKGELISASDLVLIKLLPIARIGLEKAHINKKEIEEYLELIAGRIAGRSGSQWQIASYHTLRKELKKDAAILKLTKAIHANQENNIPVHLWPPAESSEVPDIAASLVLHIMSTQLFVVSENDLAALATSIMQWNNIHHLPVENSAGKLVGLLTWSHMQKYQQRTKSDLQKVTEIMVHQPLTISPEKSIAEAIDLMKSHEYGCLPVVDNGEMVGIITIKDLLSYDKGKDKQSIK